MKKVVVSLVLGDEWKRVGEVSVPTFQAYAKKVGADFFCITERKICPDSSLSGWEKLQIRDLLKTYDRAVFFDADAIVRSDTPNLFDLVPHGYFGGFRPTSPWAGMDGNGWYENHARWFGVETPKTDGHYCNTGVMVLDQTHLPVLENPPRFPKSGSFEEPWINIGLQARKLPVMALSWKFNNIKAVHWGFRPLQAHVIHIQKMGCGLNTWDVADVLREWLEVWRRLGF